MAAPGRAMRTTRPTPGELHRRHVQRKKVIALIAGLLLLPVSLLLIVSFDRGALGRAVSGALGLPFAGDALSQPEPATLDVAQAPTPAPCLDTVFNGLALDAETGARLGGVRVTASFGASAETSPDGGYNILVCYDPAVHDEFSLVFEKEGYESASLDVVTKGYPGLGFRVADVAMVSLLAETPVPTLFQPPRQTPLPTPTATLFQPPRQTPLPTATSLAAGSGAASTPAPTRAAGSPAPTGAATAAPPNMLPATGVPETAFPGQAIGFVLLAISLVLIAAGVWPDHKHTR